MRISRRIPAVLAVALTSCLDPNEPGNLVPKTVEEDASLPRIEVNGTLLHAETYGDPANPLVLVLHGGPGADYRALLPLSALADDGFFVVFWDQRGCGLSKRHPAEDYSLEVVLQDLKQVIDYYGERPMLFIGHSWGAMYATWFINTYGTYDGRIRGAVLSEPGAFTLEGLVLYAQRNWGTLSYFSESMSDITWARQIFTPEDHERTDYALHMLELSGGVPGMHLDPNNLPPNFRSGAVAYATLPELAMQEGFDWTTHLSSFAPHVLFLRGDLNEAMPLSHQQELASHYSSSEVITIPGVGHEMIWERPTEYLREVRAYFERIGFSGGAR